MPKTKRDLLKRKLGYVLGSLDKASSHALELLTIFAESAEIDLTDDEWLETVIRKPDPTAKEKLCAMLQTAMMRTLQAEQVYRAFAKSAWGKVPDNIERWTNTGQEYREVHEIDAQGD